MNNMYESHRNKHFLCSIPMALSLVLAISNTSVAYSNPTSNRFEVVQNNHQISGRIVDSTGEPLIGVNILEKGTSNGTITDFDGKFTLNVSPNSTLVISYIGYKEQEVKVNNQTSFNITLHEDTETLDEVVVIGYGAVKKADLAGSVSVMDNKAFRDQPITQASDALQGRMSGVNVVSDGIPGGSVKIRVRGTNSINKSNDPLYVVDGIVRESELEGINPEDIQHAGTKRCFLHCHLWFTWSQWSGHNHNKVRCQRTKLHHL